MDGLRTVFSLNPIEFTIEANPGTVDLAWLESFRRMGANRNSFGLQASRDRLLKCTARIPTMSDLRRSL